MATVKTYNPETGNWEVRGTSQASSLGIIDLQDNYKSPTVEGSLREIKEKDNEQDNLLEAVRSTTINNTNAVNQIRAEFDDHLANHPGGGGGNGESACKITSTFTGGVIEAETDLEIPIFFTSSNKGNGTAYVTLNNVEVGMYIIPQGSVMIKIGTLNNIKNEIGIYVKDAKSAMSNLLSWEVIKGGIDFQINFDFSLDYSVSDNIRIPYKIETPIEDPLILEITYNGKKTERPIEKGPGQHILSGKELGVGVHEATIRVVSGIFKSKTYNVSLVIVSSYDLYLSSSFKGGDFEYGKPIIIPYRISKLSTEYFTVARQVNGVAEKTLSSQAGSYTWTVTGLAVGEHTLRIDVTGVSGDTAFLEFKFTVRAGEYVPVEVTKVGLVAWFDSYDMTNEDVAKNIWIDRSSRKTKAELHNFNFKTNGWMEIKDEKNEVIDRVLTCDNGGYVEVDYAPFSENALYGTTIEILYKGNNIGDEQARVLDCTDIVGSNEDGTPIYKGTYINIINAEFRSAINSGIVSLDEDTEVRITFVLDRFNKFCMIYIDAVLCRAFYLTDAVNGPNKNYEDFKHSKKLYLNSEKGTSKSGACDIKVLRIYDRALSADEVLKNHIADIKDLKVQKEKYNFNYNNATIPVIRMYGSKADFDKMSGAQSVPIRVRYESPNADFFGESFDYPKCNVLWQGSSSLTYVLKNYTIYLKDENMSDVMYSPFKNGIPENVFCLKADYVESSHANNLGLAKFVHDCLYDSKTPVQTINPNYRTTVDGFPILVYINNNDGKPDRLLGCYNFNLDRFSTYSYGYEEKSVKSLAYEINANSDTTAGAFVAWTPATGKDETTYYKEDYKLLYPPSRQSNDNYEEIKRLVRWVDSASDEVFKDQIREYFNLEYLMRYYLFVMTVGAVDSLGKNMKLVSYDGGKIWYPEFYDMDTVLGLNNTGFLVHDSDIEVEEGIFMTTGSLLWQKLRILFQAELRDEYAKMRLSRFTVDNFMKYLYGDQISQIPEVNYNLDMQSKYLDFGAQYLFACHGNRYHHMKKWLRERLVYLDTLMGYTGSTADYITIRANKLGNVSLWLESYIPIYMTVKWRDVPDEIVGGVVTNPGKTIKRIGRNEKVRFDGVLNTATDQNVVIYAGRYLKSIDGLSTLRPGALLLESASKLTNLECHSDLLIESSVSKMTNLQYIDFSGCKIFGDANATEAGQKLLDLTKCKYLKRVDISGTNLTALDININGGSIEELIYPTGVQSMILSNQPRLKSIGLPYGYRSMLRNSEPVMGKKYTFTGEISKPIITDSSSHLTFKDPIKVINNQDYKIKMNKAGGTVTINEFTIEEEFIKSTPISMTSSSVVTYTADNNASMVVVVLNSSGPWVEDDMKDCRMAIESDIDTFDECKALQSFSLTNCSNVGRLTQFPYPVTEYGFEAIKYVQNFTLINSLSLTSMNFNGFSKLRKLELSGMNELLKVSFNDMNKQDDTGTLNEVKISNCPKITEVEMNISNADKAIKFATYAVMDLGSLYSLKRIESNTPIIGLETIILNRDIEDIILAKEFNQSWDGDIKNLWSYSSSSDNLAGNYVGIDFAGLHIKNIDLTAAKKIPNSKNFNISPVDTFKINNSRDGVIYPYIAFNGTIDLSNYNGTFSSLFKGADLTNAQLIMNRDFSKADFSNMFEDATFGESLDLMAVLNRIKNASNLSYMFAGSNVKRAILPESINQDANITYAFKNCKDIVDPKDLVLTNKIINIEGILEGCIKLKKDFAIPNYIVNAKRSFKDCIGMTEVHANWETNYINEITPTDCYAGSVNISLCDGEPINGLNEIPADWGGYGFDKDSVNIYEIDTADVSSISTKFLYSKPLYVDWGDGTVDSNTSHTYKSIGIFTVKVKFDFSIPDGQYACGGNSKTAPEGLKNSVTKVLQVSNRISNKSCLFKDMKKLTTASVDLMNTSTASEMLSGCSKLLDVTINYGVSNASILTDISSMLKDCIVLRTAMFNPSVLMQSVTTIKDIYKNCPKLTETNLLEVL